MINTTPATTTTVVGRITIARLYLVRAVIALIWAGLLAVAVSSGGSLAPEQTSPHLPSHF